MFTTDQDHHSMVNDYFSQAAIDFFLGNVTHLIFEEFEADMMIKDPAISMSRMRELAIEQCQRRVIADESEEFISGWVLLAPSSVHVIRSTPLIEVVVLLTERAMYVCQFDWNTDKVSSFERIALESIRQITWGTYVTSTLSKTHLDEERNVGLVLEYTLGNNAVRRRNTRTLDTADDEVGQPTRTRTGFQENLAGLVGRQRSQDGPLDQQQQQQIALKAPYATTSSTPASSGMTSGGQTEEQFVAGICEDVERLVTRARGEDADEDRLIVKRAVIVGADEARQGVGIMGHLAHSLKRLVWA